MASLGKVLATAALLLSLAHISAPTLTGFKIEMTDKSSMETRVSNDGVTYYHVKRELLMKLVEEARSWHWTPYLKTRMMVVDGTLLEQECSNASSVDSFPAGIFNDEQLRAGGVVLYMLLGIYAFTLIAFVCNDYFIPSVEIICDKLGIPQNVAAATFMSVATSSPEFFVNTISTFLTESDMGIGTIVGSALFNALGVAAIGSLAAIRPIRIKKTPVIRDVVVYVVNVSVLVVIVWDGVVRWQEATVLGVMYIAYFVIMFNSQRVFDRIKRWRGKMDVYKFGDEPQAQVDEDEKPDVVENGLSTAETAADTTHIPMIQVDDRSIIAPSKKEDEKSRDVLESRRVSFSPSLVTTIGDVNNSIDSNTLKEMNAKTEVTTSSHDSTNGSATKESVSSKISHNNFLQTPINNFVKLVRGSDRSSSESSNSETSFDNTEYRIRRSRSFTSSQALWPSEHALEKIESPWATLWRYPKEKSVLSRVVWVYSWPIRLVLALLVPAPESCARLYPLTFLMCIVCIGANSYLVSWTMTVLGHVFYIPDSVMGMTFLAFGGCVPEACGIFIMSRRGEGGMGISNAIGANSLAILFALGVPWLIKTLVLIAEGAEDPVIRINSSGIDFVIGSLLVAVICLVITLYIGKFTLRRQTGIVFVCLYVIFVTFVILVEMGVIIDLQLLC